MSEARTAEETVSAGADVRPDTGRLDEAVDVALQLFLEHGYDNTPMSLVARQLNLTKAGVYHYFESKEVLLYTAHKRAMERHFQPIFETAAQEPDPEKRLRRMLFSHARALALEPTAGLLIRESRRLSPEHLKDVKRTWRRLLTAVREAIVELQHEGRCNTGLSPTYAAFAAIGMVSWISFWFDPSRVRTADAVAATMADIFMAGLFAAGSAVDGDADGADRRAAARALGPRREARKLD